MDKLQMNFIQNKSISEELPEDESLAKGLTQIEYQVSNFVSGLLKTLKKSIVLFYRTRLRRLPWLFRTETLWAKQSTRIRPNTGLWQWCRATTTAWPKTPTTAPRKTGSSRFPSRAKFRSPMSKSPSHQPRRRRRRWPRNENVNFAVLHLANFKWLIIAFGFKNCCCTFSPAPNSLINRYTSEKMLCLVFEKNLRQRRLIRFNFVIIRHLFPGCIIRPTPSTV